MEEKGNIYYCAGAASTRKGGLRPLRTHKNQLQVTKPHGRTQENIDSPEVNAQAGIGRSANHRRVAWADVGATTGEESECVGATQPRVRPCTAADLRTCPTRGRGQRTLGNPTNGSALSQSPGYVQIKCCGSSAQTLALPAIQGNSDARPGPHVASSFVLKERLSSSPERQAFASLPKYGIIVWPTRKRGLHSNKAPESSLTERSAGTGVRRPAASHFARGRRPPFVRRTWGPPSSTQPEIARLGLPSPRQDSPDNKNEVNHLGKVELVPSNDTNEARIWLLQPSVRRTKSRSGSPEGVANLQPQAMETAAADRRQRYLRRKQLFVSPRERARMAVSKEPVEYRKGCVAPIQEYISEKQPACTDEVIIPWPPAKQPDKTDHCRKPDTSADVRHNSLVTSSRRTKMPSNMELASLRKKRVKRASNTIDKKRPGTTTRTGKTGPEECSLDVEQGQRATAEDKAMGSPSVDIDNIAEFSGSQSEAIVLSSLVGEASQTWPESSVESPSAGGPLEANSDEKPSVSHTIAGHSEKPDDDNMPSSTDRFQADSPDKPASSLDTIGWLLKLHLEYQYKARRASPVNDLVLPSVTTKDLQQSVSRAPSRGKTDETSECTQSQNQDITLKRLENIVGWGPPSTAYKIREWLYSCVESSEAYPVEETSRNNSCSASPAGSSRAAGDGRGMTSPTSSSRSHHRTAFARPSRGKGLLEKGAEPPVSDYYFCSRCGYSPRQHDASQLPVTSSGDNSHWRCPNCGVRESLISLKSAPQLARYVGTAPPVMRPVGQYYGPCRLRYPRGPNNHPLAATSMRSILPSLPARLRVQKWLDSLPIPVRSQHRTDAKSLDKCSIRTKSKVLNNVTEAGGGVSNFYDKRHFKMADKLYTGKAKSTEKATDERLTAKAKGKGLTGKGKGKELTGKTKDKTEIESKRDVRKAKGEEDTRMSKGEGDVRKVIVKSKGNPTHVEVKGETKKDKGKGIPTYPAK